jgi:hypothetical protein
MPSTAQVTLELATPLMAAANCSVCPKVSDACTGEMDTVELGCVPVPARVAVWRVDGASLLNVRYPVRGPVAEGVNVI